MSPKTKRRFALRTVQNGSVIIDGNAYAPSERHMAYDGRLDGQRFVFGRYSHTDEFVCLWGTETAYHGIHHPDWPECHPECKAEPHCIDSHYVWQWWEKAA